MAKEIVKKSTLKIDFELSNEFSDYCNENDLIKERVTNKIIKEFLKEKTSEEL